MRHNINPQAYPHLESLLSSIKNHVNRESHAIVLVNDYMELKTVFAGHDVSKLIEIIEQKITSARGWDAVKRTFIPAMDPEMQEILKPLLEK